MSLASALRADYAVLEVTAPEAGELATRIVDGAPTPWGPASLAVDAAGHRHLLIPVPPGMELDRDARSTGIQLGPHELIEAGQRRRFLDISCQKPYLHDIFLRIAAEMLEAIASAGSRPDHRAIAVLDRWRDLLARGRSEGPTREQLTGLYAELLHLYDLCRLDPRALATWHGPDNAIQDFAGGDVRLEVKASRSRQGWRCTIHGLEQLHCPPSHTLFFSMAQLEVGGSGGETIPGIVDRLLELGIEAPSLYSRLDAAGLAVAHLQAASEPGFRLIERRIWRVEEGFPRLTPESLVAGVSPIGVAAIHYDLELTALSIPALTSAEILEVHTRLAGSVA